MVVVQFDGEVARAQGIRPTVVYYNECNPYVGNLNFNRAFLATSCASFFSDLTCSEDLLNSLLYSLWHF